ncbi:GNAT family N-acetyltransferase [Staphylococcus sp. IVB6181]|uniref:GNAT family N-acetyltransferase n=1 Tax=Staphylococcus sp. IVB6181 TaxID=2929481 RepID=UPI0021CF9653|nr:GNAT family protein [Staphylococcus sp. IVB6181]UXV35385.1 GNAT family N-acetyltransferase [Staphylococcus sp. IVB6181]
MEFEYLSEETERLVIRPLEEKDYDMWMKGFCGRDVSQNPYDEGKLDMSVCTRKWYKQLIEKHQRLLKADDIYIFGIFRKSDGVHIGNLDVVTLSRQYFQWAECGYAIHNQFWRQGYGYEALAAMLKIAERRLKYHRIEAHVNIGNEPSIGLLEKAGFRYECTREQFLFENGEWTDHYVYFKNLNSQPPINF